MLAFILSSSLLAHSNIAENSCNKKGNYLECYFSYLENDKENFSNNSLVVDIYFREHIERLIKGLKKDSFNLPASSVTLFQISNDGQKIPVFAKNILSIDFSKSFFEKINFKISSIDTIEPAEISEQINFYFNQANNLVNNFGAMIESEIKSHLNIFSTNYEEIKSERIDVSQVLRAKGVEAQVGNKIPGNESEVFLHQAYLDVSETATDIYLHFEVDAKHETCLTKPWPFNGRWCAFPWRINTNIGISATLNRECNVTKVDIDKWGTSTRGLARIIEPILHAAFYLFEGYARNFIKNALESAIAKDENLRDLCQM
jgi:hypothetical protein